MCYVLFFSLMLPDHVLNDVVFFCCVIALIFILGCVWICCFVVFVCFVVFCFCSVRVQGLSFMEKFWVW